MLRTDLRKQKLLDHIDEFRELKDGWDSYGAPPISEKAIGAAKAFVAHFQAAPTTSGGVGLEVVFGRTERGGFEFSVGFDAEGQVVEFWTSYEDGYAGKDA